MQIRALERIFTLHFLAVAFGGLALACAMFFAAAASGVSLHVLATITDVFFKLAAVIFGSSWALNRYFTARTDVLQIRVDPTIEIMTAPTKERLFVCRLDIVNTGKALTSAFDESLEFYSVEVENGEITYRVFHTWPEQHPHPVDPIEPGAWSAVSTAVLMPQEARIVQVYLALRFETGELWTWHRHFAATIT